MEGDVVNLIGVCTPEKERYQKIAAALSAWPECERYQIHFQSLEPGFSLAGCPAKVILADILAQAEFDRLFREYQSLAHPPFVALFHYGEPLAGPPAGSLLMFGAYLDMTGDPAQVFSGIAEEFQRNASFYTINAQRQLYRVPVSEILYCKMEKHCVEFYLPNTCLKSWGTLAQEMEKLRPLGFARIHKSYGVNLRHIRKSTSRQVELTGGVILPVGRKFKEPYFADHEHFLGQRLP